ncbi:MAG: UDP binding domain-containing protein, partial [Pseudomonadota bacterium]
ESVGYHPQVILAGRRINDGMGGFIARKTAALLAECGRPVRGAQVTVLGLAYKEDTPDIRNSRVPDIVRALQAEGAEVHVHDPVAQPADAEREYGIALESWEALPRADALILAVAHRALRALGPKEFAQKVKPGGCVLDVKAILERRALERAGVRVWRL